MAYLGKNLAHVRRLRLKRVFIGTFGTMTRQEKWVEAGHFLKGMRLMLDEIFEFDGDGHISNDWLPCGWIPEGEWVPSQNAIEDYEFYNSTFRGKRSMAFLVGTDQLWLFRSKYLGNKKVIDNRLSISNKVGYDSPREQAMKVFSGWIPGFEVFKVKDFKMVGNRMSYTIIKQIDFSNVPKIAISGGGADQGV